METSRRRINGEIQAEAENHKLRPKRRACAQKLLSQKAPENEIMQDTRGEALAGEASGRPPIEKETSGKQPLRRAGAATVILEPKTESSKVHGNITPAQRQRFQAGAEKHKTRPKRRACAQK